MKVYDVILHIRSRLSDEESKKWHDNEIVDSINNAYIEMARILRLFLQEITFEVTKDKNTFLLPENFLDISSVKRGNFIIPIIRYSELLQNEEQYREAVAVNGMYLYFHTKHYTTYKVAFYSYFIIVDKEDSMLIPHICFNAVLYYSLFHLLQKKPHQNALKESAYYKNLYDEEIKAVQRDIYRSQETKNLTTRVIVV